MAFAAGEKLTAAKLNAEINPLFKYKTASEGVTNSTAFQNDDTLFVSVAANTNYTVEASIGTLADPTVDGVLLWTYPSGTALDWGQHNLTWTTNVFGNTGDGDWNWRRNIGGTQSDQLLFAGGGSGNDSKIEIGGLLRTGASSGTFQLWWAQRVSSASTTWVLQGSWLRLRKVA